MPRHKTEQLINLDHAFKKCLGDGLSASAKGHFDGLKKEYYLEKIVFFSNGILFNLRLYYYELP